MGLRADCERTESGLSKGYAIIPKSSGNHRALKDQSCHHPIRDSGAKVSRFYIVTKGKKHCSGAVQ